jgi:3-carboxy-cis,cis-muconate cycloisomerase
MISLLDSAVFGGLFGIDEGIAADFDDRRRIADLLDVEVALARAQASAGIIPVFAADRIATAAAHLTADMPSLRRGVAASGVPTIELVRQLRDAAGTDAAAHVHRGATSQDIVDTAAVLALRRATARIRARLKAGRTHGQHAAPIAFGLKAANWLAPMVRHWQRLAELEPRLFVVQFGGAAGTLAALGDRGLAVSDALARELGLGRAVPWHTQRDTVVEFGSWLAMVACSFGKIGQDVILLAQTEVGEVAESADAARGGSSTMPHKANQIASEMMVVAARGTAALLSALHAAAIQEHERATHGWQLEWLVLPQIVALTSGSAAHAVFVVRHLQVSAARMRENMCEAGNVVMAESLALALAGTIALDDAQALVKRAAEQARASREALPAVVRRAAQERGVDAGIDWDRLADPAAHLGATNEIIDRIVDEAKRTFPPAPTNLPDPPDLPDSRLQRR